MNKVLTVTEEERAKLRADAEMTGHYMLEKVYDSDQESENTDEDEKLTDGLAALLHWADAHGTDFDTALERARMHHAAEIEPPREWVRENDVRGGTITFAGEAHDSLHFALEPLVKCTLKVTTAERVFDGQLRELVSDEFEQDGELQAVLDVVNDVDEPTGERVKVNVWHADFYLY